MSEPEHISDRDLLNFSQQVEDEGFIDSGDDATLVAASQATESDDDLIEASQNVEALHAYGLLEEEEPSQVTTFTI